MRTTIRIDDELYREVRVRAMAAGRTVGSVIEDALRRALAEDQVLEPPQPLPTFHGTGVMPGVDLTSNADLRDVMDAGSAVDALR